MAVNKLTPRYLNKDDDNRLVKSTEMTDALNVRISSDDDGDALVLKNAYGNQELTLETALPAGTNRVIGSTANEQSGSIYYFVWNSNNNHSIYKYSVGSNKARLVYRDSVLAFGENGFVKGNVITSIDGDELLYFNTGTSEPKKINASKALRDPSYPGGTTDEEKLLFLTVAKQPPLDPPTYNIVNNASLSENRISDKVFQFAYRYVYADGEISAMSPYSSLTASIAQLRDGFNTQSAKDFYNQINVFVKNTIADVKKIQVYAREGNEGTFYQISEFNNSGNTGIKTINFTNSTVGEALSINDKNKLYDNVPQLADSQDIVSGRLMYGGYTEGYPNTDTAVSLTANYKDIEDIYNISLTAASNGSSTGKTTITLDDTDLPTTFTEDSIIYLNVNFSGDTVTINGGSGTTSALTFPSTTVTITDLDGSNAKTVTLTETKDPIDFIPSGISISEKIFISANSTKAQAIAAIRTRLFANRYNLMLAPTREQNVVFDSTGTALTNFTAKLSGRAIIEPQYVSDSVISLKMTKVELYLGGVDTPLSLTKSLRSLLTSSGQSQAAVEVASSGGIKDFASKVFEGGSERNVVSAQIITVTALNYEFSSPYVIGTSFVSAQVDSSTKSFKSGSSHKMGIVYYDDRNRSSGVQELGDVYINALNDRATEDNLYGAASVVMRLPDSAPSWAKRWAPVYQGRGTSELKLMYSVDGAFVPYRTNSSLRNISNNNRIYLSLNSAFKTNVGYNDTTGANLEYKFQKGDKLRVVEYGDGQRLSTVFKVVGYELLDETDDNPILDTSAERTVQRTTGNFLVIEEDEGAVGFTSNSIINRSTNWNDRCVVEIYNSNVTDTDIYYEIGKSYEIINGEHKSERGDEKLVFMDVVSSDTSAVPGAVLDINSQEPIFKGDVLKAADEFTMPAGSFTAPFTIYINPETGKHEVDPEFSLRTYAGISTTKNIYVDKSVASSGDGSSWAQAFKTIDEGIADIDQDSTVYIKAGYYYYNESSKARQIPQYDVEFIAVGGKVYNTGDYNNQVSSWTLDNGAYKATLPASVNDIVISLDRTVDDGRGNPKRLEDKLSAAAVQAAGSEGGSFWDEANSTIWIKMPDGREPDDDLVMYVGNLTGGQIGGIYLRGSNYSVYANGIICEGWSSSFRTRDISGVSTGLKLYIEDCGGNDSFFPYGDIYIFNSKFVGYNPGGDVLNYDGNTTTAVVQNVVEYKVDSSYAYVPFIAGGTSSQCSTGHNGCNILRIDSKYSYAPAQGTADVIGCKTVILSSVSDNNAIGYFAGTGTPNSEIWIYDSSTNSPVALDVSSNGIGYIYNFAYTGTINGTPTILSDSGRTIGNTITVTNVYNVTNGVYSFKASDRSTTPLTAVSRVYFDITTMDQCIDLNLGDVYFRRRSLYTSIANDKLITGEMSNVPTTAIVKYIEDYSVSDFFASKSSSIGRPIAYIPDAKTVKRSGSITYSEPYLQEGTFNGLSSFNLSLANFKDLAYEYGSIKALIGYNERLYFIQENRSGVLAVNRNVIEAGSGDNLITLSKSVLQSEQYYVGEYGTSNPESVASRDGMVYFTDVKRGKVLRIDGQGLTDISDVNMSSYFDEKFEIISKYSPTTVIGGVDKDNDEYIVSSDTITEATVSINTDQYVYTAQLDSSGTQVKADYEYNPDAVFSFNTEPRTFDAICDEFQDSVGAVVYLDELADGGVVYVGIPYEVSNLYGVATNRNYDFFVAINVNMFLPGFVFDNGYCTSDDVGSINPASSVLDAFTAAYGTDTRVWNTRYSFIPESIVSLHNDLYTFKSGKIYKHSEDADRNTYYGGAVAESIVEVVSNESPSAIKTFESISLEGDTAWDAVVSTTNQSAVIDDTSFQQKEGFYYAYIHGDTNAYGSSITSVSSTSELFSLGVVGADVVSNNTITFSNAINTIAFPLGSTATLYKINGNQLDTLGVYPLSVTGQKSLAVSGNISLSAGDLIVVVGNSAIEGDQIRDYFAKIKLTKTTSAPVELFAVNAVIADSKLHN